jgi:hypothetical protein
MARAEIEYDGKDVYVVYNGRRIAKRGRTDSPQAFAWTSLDTPYTVTAPADLSWVDVKLKRADPPLGP